MQNTTGHSLLHHHLHYCGQTTLHKQNAFCKGEEERGCLSKKKCVCWAPQRDFIFLMQKIVQNDDAMMVVHDSCSYTLFVSLLIFIFT